MVLTIDADFNRSTTVALHNGPWVSEWAAFLFGKRGDEVFFNGVSMPQGCEVEDVTGVEIHGRPPNQVIFGDSDLVNTHPGHGYSLVRPAGLATNGLETAVHWWHDGTGAIVMRTKYYVQEPDGTSCLVPGLSETW